MKKIDYTVLQKDTPIGYALGQATGKIASGILLTLVNPLTGLSEAAGFGEGLFSGLKDGLEITRARFAVSKTRGEMHAVSRQGNKLGKKLEETLNEHAKLAKRVRELPRQIHDEIMQDMEREFIEDEETAEVTPASS